ncbi:MAG: carboxypeptidase-like regulatory domain-containing protein, partial [Sinomicrobium sp.]|nr:carboxypeptidase-like regulatory domain-containing protein [Sinomicrobium sp.]
MKSKFIGVLMLLMAFVVHASFAQQRTITGNVTDEDGIVLPGVSIVVKGTNRGTQTDFDGNYTIEASVGETLVFTYLGQRKEERTIGASDLINIRMTEETEALEEVVIIAYGQQSRKKLVQSVATIDNES